MTAPALTIAFTDLRRTFGERHALFWIFVAPLIFATFFGVLLRPSTPSPTQLSIVDEDAPGDVARRLSERLTADGIRARAAVAGKPSRFTLVVPKGAAAALAADTPVKLVLRAGADQTEEERRLQFKIQKALVDLTLEGSAPAAAAPPPTEPLSVVNESLGVRTRTYGFQYAIPAYLVMFSFMNLLVSGAGIAEERATGRLRRLALAPVSFNQIIVGKLLVRVVIGWAQMAYLLLLGVFVFRIAWGGNPVTLFAVLSVIALTAAALGLLAGTAFEDPDKCANLAMWSVMILSPLGGLWWPLEIVGPTLRRVADFVPTGWAMQAVNSIMGFGAGPREVVPFVAPLAGLFALSLVLAARRLRRQVIA